MIVISLTNVNLILGSRLILQNLNWEIQNDQKIGLIGPNGMGKSSVLKVIIGELFPEPGGTVVRAKGITVGYLPQQIEFDPNEMVEEIALTGNPRYAYIKSELDNIEDSISSPEVYKNPKRLAKALDNQHKLLVEYTALGGDNYPSLVAEILRGLGLEKTDFKKPIGLLSSGQRKLVGLARLLVARPDVMLLDEPDNHLDLQGKAFLESFIAGYPGAIVLVSHDRYLLDAVVTHIADIEDRKLSTFRGDYSSYMVDKQERLARQDELFRVQQKEIARLEAAIKRYAVWAKLYDNEKFANRARAIQGRLDRMDKIDRPMLDRKKMGLDLGGWRGSNKVIELTHIRKSFDEKVILDNIDLLIFHGERVGLIGINGSGKTLLLRLIMEAILPEAGEIIIGPSVRWGYYSQEDENLDLNRTPVEVIRNTGNLSESNAVSILVRYLFTYEQCQNRISELSGGERSRLQLALLMLSGANFLLLDEPTNNLDIVSTEVLEDALEEFVGSVLVISHDRYFLDRTVDRILELKNGVLEEYVGGYSDYVLKKDLQTSPLVINQKSHMGITKLIDGQT